jgi:hypothetical protein
MSDLPAPLTPPECDMRGLPFMPLDVVRVIDSDLFLMSTGEEFKAAFTLWAKSWNQIPAGSLPDNDRLLSRLSQTTCDWSEIKDVALRGWVRCSDGRLYHPVVCEKALEAMGRRVDRKNSVMGDVERKERERSDRKRMMEDLRGIGIVLKWDTRTNDLRNEWSKHFDACHAPVTHENVTGVTDENVKNGGKHDKTTPVTDLSQPPVTACHEPVMAKTGTGTGTENNTQTFYSENPRAKKSENQNPRNEPPPNPKFAKFIHAAGMANFPSDLGKMLDLWERDGMDFDFTVIPAVERLAEKRRKDGGKQPYTASYFDSAVREMFAEDKAAETARERRLAENAKIENDMKERDIREATYDVEWVLDWRKTPPGTDGRPIDRLLDEAWDKAVATFHRYDVPVPGAQA